MVEIGQLTRSQELVSVVGREVLLFVRILSEQDVSRLNGSSLVRQRPS
jgi:hypothetical protein